VNVYISITVTALTKVEKGETSPKAYAPVAYAAAGGFFGGLTLIKLCARF